MIAITNTGTFHDQERPQLAILGENDRAADHDQQGSDTRPPETRKIRVIVDLTQSHDLGLEAPGLQSRPSYTRSHRAESSLLVSAIDRNQNTFIPFTEVIRGRPQLFSLP